MTPIIVICERRFNKSLISNMFRIHNQPEIDKYNPLTKTIKLKDGSFIFFTLNSGLKRIIRKHPLHKIVNENTFINDYI